MTLQSIRTYDAGEVWEWASDVYLQLNMKLAFPKDTDPQRTYQWRYCSALAEKFTKWQLTENEAKKFIKIVITYSKKKGFQHKGLAIFHQGNILEVAYKEICELNTNDNLSILRDTKKWLDAQVKDTYLQTLLQKNDRGMANVTMWYQANKLPVLYLSLSKSCYKSISILRNKKADDELLLPKTTTLYRTRLEFFNSEDVHEAKKILNDDWRNLPCL